MNLFVNFYTDSYGQAGQYYIYKLYSGESVDVIIENIIKDIKHDYNFISAIEKLKSTRYIRSMKDLSIKIDNIVQKHIDRDYGDLTNFEIKISEPYTDLSNAIDFYNKYSDLDQDGSEILFDFHGSPATVIQNALPYLAGLSKDLRVSIDTSVSNRILDKIK